MRFLVLLTILFVSAAQAASTDRFKSFLRATQTARGAFVADHEVHHVVEHLKRLAKPEYLGEVLEPAPAEEAGGVDGEPSGEKDPLYDQAVEIVLRTRRPSISLVQRHLRIGYNRAARLIEDMERAGMVSAMQSNGNREVLVPAKAE